MSCLSVGLVVCRSVGLSIYRFVVVSVCVCPHTRVTILLGQEGRGSGELRAVYSIIRNVTSALFAACLTRHRWREGAGLAHPIAEEASRRRGLGSTRRSRRKGGREGGAMAMQ